jgi:hypothetical protein
LARYYGDVAGRPQRAAPTGDRENALTEAAARWLEGYLAAAPAEIGLGLVRALLKPKDRDLRLE